MKVGIVGAGNVGSTIAYTLSMSSQVSEIVLVDKNADKARGEILDLQHGLPFIPYTTLEYGDVGALEGMDVVVVTAGIGRRSGETRLDLARKNNELFRELVPEMVGANPTAIYLIVSNPVDVLTYAALRYSGLSAKKVLGSGNVLDSARFRSMLGAHFRIDPANVHAYVLGEHGDSSFPVWSHAFVGCTPLRNLDGYDEAKLTEIFEGVKSVAAEVIKLKGATYYAVSLGVSKIIQAIYLDQNRVLPVSTLLSDFCGVSDVCLSVPAVINRGGVEKVLQIPLSEAEERSLKASAEKVGGVLGELGLRK
jgi:L-lactate dehydrogenase